MPNFDRKWWINAETLALPADATKQIICPNPQSLLGQDMPPATNIDVIDPLEEAQKPIVDFVFKPIDSLAQGFDPTRPFDNYDNDNRIYHALKVA